MRLSEVAAEPMTPREAILAAAEGLVSGEKKTVTLPATPQTGLAVTGELESGSSYVLEFEHEGYLPGASHRSHVRDVGEVRLPDVTLLRLRTVAGQVTDQDGNPLADVTVFQSGNGSPPTETSTASDGSFSLDGVPEGVG